MAKRSSGSYMKHVKFNPTQIKNGWIVRMRKDGTIKAYIEKYEPGKKKKGKLDLGEYLDEYYQLDFEDMVRQRPPLPLFPFHFI